MTKNSTTKILITGASGYVGGRLLKSLVKHGYKITCLARKPEYLKDKVAKDVEIIKGDVLDKASLQKALANIDIAFYLVHSMGAKESFEEKDRIAATNFREAAQSAGEKRIIYLGGLGNSEKTRHHRFRQP